MRILGALLCMLLLAGCGPSESTDDRILLARMNLEEGERYRETNGRRSGVRTLPSGLQIEILEQGTGDKPTERDVVRVHYRGLHVDGREFDNSHRRGEPVTFALDGTIAGWAEGLQRLPVGSRARLVIPHWL
ncbi:MAG: FKBP-type peptidyl-prolyl cis-trans isomerase, partial [Ectothiorhodospiraceae bacterium]|nr:FKBP-type peptidyl-prolyl cis-trans isomerase [Ectothiorhodospiraceae bacterium]